MRKIKIAIASGKGGTGKTLVSTNLFFAIQQQNSWVTLIDCDAEEPNDMVFFTGNLIQSVNVEQTVPVMDEDKCVFCGRCHDYCNYKAIFLLPSLKIIKVIDDLCHGCGACMVACNEFAINEKEVVLGEINHYSITERSRVIEARMKVGSFSPVRVIKKAIAESIDNGVVLMDAPPGTSCPFIHAVLPADYVILVTESTPFGLSDLQRSVDALKTLEKPFGVIVNRVGLGDRAVFDYLKRESIPVLLEIPFNTDVAYYYSNGAIVSKYKPQWVESLLVMLDKIMELYGDCDH